MSEKKKAIVIDVASVFEVSKEADEVIQLPPEVFEFDYIDLAFEHLRSLSTFASERNSFIKRLSSACKEVTYSNEIATAVRYIALRIYTQLHAELVAHGCYDKNSEQLTWKLSGHWIGRHCPVLIETQ